MTCEFEFTGDHRRRTPHFGCAGFPGPRGTRAPGKRKPTSVKICVICAFPERCEAEAVCPFEKNWPTEQQRVARENRANKERLRERAIRSLEDALRRLTSF